MVVEKFFSVGCVGFKQRGRLSRGGDLLSFACPKESKQRKGHPAAPDPPLRYGPPPVRAPDGPAANSPATQAQTARLAASVWGCAREAGVEGSNYPAQAEMKFLIDLDDFAKSLKSNSHSKFHRELLSLKNGLNSSAITSSPSNLQEDRKHGGKCSWKKSISFKAEIVNVKL